MLGTNESRKDHSRSTILWKISREEYFEKNAKVGERENTADDR